MAAGIPWSPVNAQGIGYEVSPVVTQLRWDDALGLRDDYLLGGQVGLRFGRIAELRGYYLMRSDLRASAEALPIGSGFVPPAEEQEVAARHYGAELRLNLLSGSVVPYLLGGGGVLRLDPEGLDATEQILLKAGGGVRFALSRAVSAEVFAEDWAFRLNRFLLFAPGGALDDPEADEVRHNLAVGAAVNLALGGDPADPTPGLRGATLTLEPFAGRLSFADELPFARQNLVGARAGLDLNRLVGLRGFYWRGVNDDLDRFAPVQGYGGEVQFNLGTGGGVIPHLLAGAGQIEFREGFAEPVEATPPNRTMLIVGGGLSLPLTERLRAHATLRDYILGEENGDDLSRVDQLYHNPVLSAGLSFAVGGRSPAPAVPPRTGPDPELERLRAENERLRQLAEQRLAVVDSVVVEVDPLTGDTLTRQIRVAAPTVPAPERTMVVPVPERGEIYIRFGEPGAVAPVRIGEGTTALAPPAEAAPTEVGALSAAELRMLIRDAVREEVRLETRAGAVPTLPAAPVAPTSGLTELERLELLEQRLAQRIEATIARQLTEQERRITRLETLRDPGVPLTPREVRPRAPAVEARSPVEASPPPERRLRAQFIRPYLGANLNDPSQFVVGSRVDLGPLWPNLPVRVVPEVALGFGDDATSFLVAGNLQYEFGRVAAVEPLHPYVHAGLGLWRDDRMRGTLNYGVGASVPLGTVPSGPIRVFVEQQGVGIFRRFRLLVGTQVVF